MDAYIFSAVYIIVGLFSFIFALKEKWRYNILLRRGIKTMARAQALSDGDDGIILKAEFTDWQGIQRTVYSRGGNSDWGALNGTIVEVLYERRRPEEARLVADLKMRINLSAFSFGLIFTLTGVVVLVLHLLGIDVMTD